mgnify:CR=1 FL=1
MANHKSAIKRARQNQVRRMRNRSVKTRVKNTVKEIRHLADEDPGRSAQSLARAQSIIDMAAKKGVIHKRTASRKIARLSRYVNTGKAS